MTQSHPPVRANSRTRSDSESDSTTHSLPHSMPHSMPNATEIVNFLEVSKTLNISRAAERLGVTQPTLSLSIQRLEHFVGTSLLLRSKTGVKLTKAGSRFAMQAKNLLDQWQSIRAETLSEESEVRGTVSIGCHVSVALYSVSGFAGQLMRDHPDLEIALEHDLSRKITERVISFELDCGIVVNPVAHPDLRIVSLCEDEVLFWRGTGPFSNSNDSTNSLANDVLLCDPNLLQSQALVAKLKKLPEFWKFRRKIHSSSLEVVAKLASTGAGIAILPTRIALGDPGLKLKPLFSKGPIHKDRICLIYRPEAQKRLAFKTVMKAIEASFDEKKN